jgi:hypothetical protein
MGFICEKCKNRGEIPEELKPLAEEMVKYYPVVTYCQSLKLLIVANPEIPTQTKTECEKYSG